MSELFDEDDLVEDPFHSEDKIALDDKISSDISETNNLDARRRLEMALEAKRLRDELEDFLDDFDD